VIWIAGLGASTGTEQLSNIDASLAKSPQGGLRDALLWAKGSLLAQWNGIAIYSERDLQHALALADAATSVLTTLRDTGLASFSRDRAAVAIAHLYTTKTGEATLRLLAASDPPAPERIVPRVECVERRTGNSFSARFAYTNSNRGSKVISVGDLNQVTPAPRDQGQPRVFKPGDHPHVFSPTSPAAI